MASEEPQDWGTNAGKEGRAYVEGPLRSFFEGDESETCLQAVRDGWLLLMQNKRVRNAWVVAMITWADQSPEAVNS